MTNDVLYCWGDADPRLVGSHPSVIPAPKTVTQRECPPPPKATYCSNYTWENADPRQVMPSLPSLPKFVRKWSHAYDNERPHRIPNLPSNYESSQIHKECLPSTSKFVRIRGGYWWLAAQVKLEDNIMKGNLVPQIGTFYCFLEEDQDIRTTTFSEFHSDNDGQEVTIRHGNVFSYDSDTGYHWIMKSVVFPKGHPDKDVAPYKMVYMD